MTTTTVMQNGLKAPIPQEDGATEILALGSNERVRLSIHIVTEIIAVPTKSGKKPSRNDAIKFIALCKARRLNPFEGDAFLLGYDTKDGPAFSLVTAHQALLKRAELHQEYDGMESGTIVETEDGTVAELAGAFFRPSAHALVGGWARVHFKNRKVPTYRSVRLEAFNQGYGRWQKDAAGMILKCAEAAALRASFPNSLAGMYIREEQRPEDMDRVLDVTPPTQEPLPSGRQSMRKVAAPAEPRAGEEMLNNLSDAFLERGWGPQEVKDFCEQNKCRWSTLTQQQAETLWKNLPEVQKGDAAE